MFTVIILVIKTSTIFFSHVDPQKKNIIFSVNLNKKKKKCLMTAYKS